MPYVSSPIPIPDQYATKMQNNDIANQMTGVYPLWMVPTTIAEMPEKGPISILSQFVLKRILGYSGIFTKDIHQGYLWTWASTAGPPSPTGPARIPH